MKNTKRLKSLKRMKGGKYLSKGSYGCVVRPAIPCATKKRLPMNLDKYVSKIIRNPDYHLDNEILISTILSNSDLKNQYFLTIIDHCNMNNIPSTRNNIAKAVFYGKKKDEFTLVENNRKIDKEKICPIDISKTPVNIIMPYGGYDLDKIVRYTKYGPKFQYLKPMIFEFVKNLKKYFKHTVLGLIIIHKNRIAHRDIKQGNFLVDYKDATKTELIIRYTDFGLSDFLSAGFVANIDNIRWRGTRRYIPSEIFATTTIIDGLSSGYDTSYMLKRFNESTNENVKKLSEIIEDSKIYEQYLNTRVQLFNDVLEHVKKDKILPIFFGTDKNKFNGYLQKGDVYALAATIYETLREHTYYNDPTYMIEPILKDLLYNMMDMNPKTRYNAVQTLNHPYFSI